MIHQRVNINKQTLFFTFSPLFEDDAYIEKLISKIIIFITAEPTFVCQLNVTFTDESQAAFYMA